MTQMNSKTMIYAILLSAVMAIAGMAAMKLNTFSTPPPKPVSDAQRLEQLEKAAPDSAAVRGLVEHERGNAEAANEGK